MSYFMIHKDNGEILNVSGLTLLSMLADKDVVEDLLWELSGNVRRVVELTDGPAKVWRSPRELYAEPIQQHLMLSQPKRMTQDYLVDAELTLIVPVKIQCRGHSDHNVKGTVHDVFTGQQPRPKDFFVQIKPEEISSLMGKLEIGDVTAIEDVKIINVQPYYLLTDQRRA